ncbi:hypothetical protein [Zhouia amylolytica]|uniref:hypothetical protein n=1 Tax=Zhouia amylolytica TaxID=376730 RepID=UPI0020CC7880|nr:hypothetical protein [Zhouia amylolytica]MCQ0110422.1 hypothetical protein [Zhouia amylolytica]
MRCFYRIVFIIIGFINFSAFGQEPDKENEDPLSYYEKRAREDAEYEQSLASQHVEDEELFWKDQKAYEKNLKKRDKKAYKAYMKGKEAAYKEHQDSCDSSCHHSHYYHHYTSFYYYEERRPYRSPYRNANIRLRMSSLNVGVGF